ncbi:unnamed protein product [Orchesella dallaii]|uniref:Uncharacterized protein n=1 Tax=Orchesella dallaii TaxID=48710 RepID=A0ABP1PHL3_9HEXA
MRATVGGRKASQAGIGEVELPLEEGVSKVSPVPQRLTMLLPRPKRKKQISSRKTIEKMNFRRTSVVSIFEPEWRAEANGYLVRILPPPPPIANRKTPK